MGRESEVVDAFVALAETLIIGVDIDDFLQVLAERVADVLDAGAAGVLLSGADGHLQVLAASSHAMRVLEVFELQSADGPCVDAYRTGEQIVCADLRTEQRWPALTALALDAGFCAAIAVPLRLRDQRVGALNVFGGPAGHFDDRDLRVAQGLADVAAIGILQARAVTRAQDEVAQLQGALDSRVAIEQAKGALAERRGISAEEAFQLLRRHARSNGLALREVSDRVVQGWELPLT